MSSYCPCPCKSCCDPFSCQSSWASSAHYCPSLLWTPTTQKQCTAHELLGSLLPFHLLTQTLSEPSHLTCLLLVSRNLNTFFCISLQTFHLLPPSSIQYVNIQGLSAAVAVSLRCQAIVTHQTVQGL